MTVTIDSSLLVAYYQAKTGQTVGGSSTGGSSGGGVSAPIVQYAPTAPWEPSSGSPQATTLDKTVLAGGAFINQNTAKLDLPSASPDYKKLFALYEGLDALSGLADQAAAPGVSAGDLTRIQSTFARGITEVSNYTNTVALSQIRLTAGTTSLSDESSVGVPQENDTYTTATLYTGAASDQVPQFEGNVSFNMSVKRLGVTSNIAINLSDLGSAPRTMANVVNLVNSKLQAAGLVTRFAVDRTTAAPRTIQAGGQTITLPAQGDAFALQVKGDSAEQVTLSAANAAPAVYVTTSSGNPDPDKNPATNDAVIQNSLLKIDPAAPTVADSRVQTSNFSGTVGAVHASQVGSDGHLYVLADVTGTIDGQTIDGKQDTALLNYDSAGNLVYARTLGAADSASGLSLAVSADGKVAVAGSVTGDLDGATNGPINSTDASGDTDSFVTLYDNSGNEVWTDRRGSMQNDQATALAFGDNDVVYVAGKTQTAMAGATASGGYDSYLSAISTTDQGAPKTLFTQQFGTSGNDAPAGIAVDGSTVTVAANENGSGVLRSFDISQTQTQTTKTWASGTLTVGVNTLTDGVVTNSTSNQYATPGAPDATTTTTFVSSATATAGAVRSLGDLQGGAIVGLAQEGGQLYVAGDTRNAALSVGNITNAAAGGMDAFAASISSDLTDTSQDALAYYGGAGDNTVTGVAVAAGNVYLTGSAGADLPGLTPVGQKDGYMAQVNVATGAVVSSQRIGGKDGIAAGTTIAVDPNGASDLDKLGLPAGTLSYTQSNLIVSATSARAGDQFQIRTKEGGPLTTITLDASDTLNTLATKIQRATGFAANVQVVSNGTAHLLKITPLNNSSTVEILPGKGGQNLLTSLGITAGVVRNTKVVNGTSVSTAAGGNVYGLGLDPNINLSTPDAVKNAQSVIAGSLSKVRSAYQALVTLSTPASAQPAKPTTGTVPAYLKNQIANYQAGLDRLAQGF